MAQGWKISNSHRLDKMKNAQAIEQPNLFELKRDAENVENILLFALGEHLEKLGAKIVKVPNFVAKHPFRVTVYQMLADQSAEFYKSDTEKEKEK